MAIIHAIKSFPKKKIIIVGYEYSILIFNYVHPKAELQYDFSVKHTVKHRRYDPIWENCCTHTDSSNLVAHTCYQFFYLKNITSDKGQGTVEIIMSRDRDYFLIKFSVHSRYSSGFPCFIFFKHTATKECFPITLLLLLQERST